MGRALRSAQGADGANIPLWELQDSGQLMVWLAAIVLGGLAEFAYFIPLGFVAVLSLPSNSRRSGRFSVPLSAIAMAGTVAVVAEAIEAGHSWHWAAALGLVLPLLGCLFGAWVGTAWLRGRKASLWLPAKVAVLVLLVAVGAGIVLSRSIQKTPLPFEPARVTSAEKRRLVHLIRSKSPRSLAEGQTHTLRLTDHDINVLLAWGLSLGSADRKARISLTPGSVALTASVGLAPQPEKTRYLNLAVAGLPDFQQGELRLHLQQLRLGALEAPHWLCTAFSPVVTSLLRNDRHSKPLLEAIRAVVIEPNSIEVTYGRVCLPSGFREDLFGPDNASKDMLASTRAQVEHLLAFVRSLPDTEPDFSQCFQTVFALARERSIERDPVTENKAGIFALGMLLGHPRVEEFLGPVLDGSGDRHARRVLAHVTLRERSDWTKHFCVSAAITLLSDDLVSDAAGLLKEELDADTGGSGFSFSDLLADRAGTTFAVWATRDGAAARAAQERITVGFRVEDFFPPAADLPEGIADADLQLRYGGVGGKEYSRLVEEIERRIAACPAYRRPR